MATSLPPASEGQLMPSRFQNHSNQCRNRSNCKHYFVPDPSVTCLCFGGVSKHIEEAKQAAKIPGHTRGCLHTGDPMRRPWGCGSRPSLEKIWENLKTDRRSGKKAENMSPGIVLLNAYSQEHLSSKTAVQAGKHWEQTPL